MAATEIAAEREPQFLAGFFEIEHDHRRAQHVTGVEPCRRDAVDDRHRSVVRNRCEMAERCCCIRLRVERRDGRQALLGVELRDEGGVLLLDVCAVEEHDPAKVSGRIRAQNLAGKAGLGQNRYDAGMINVRVAEQHHIDARSIEWEAGILFDRFSTTPLIHAAFDEDEATIDFQQMTRAGRGAVGAAEMKFHRLAERLPARWSRGEKKSKPAISCRRMSGLEKLRPSALLGAEEAEGLGWEAVLELPRD